MTHNPFPGRKLKTPIGPNVKKLIAYKLAVDVVPPGGGMNDAVEFLTTPGAIADGWRKAAEWVREAILLIRNAADPNPWRAVPDEGIAAHLLAKIDEKRKENHAR